MITDFTGRELKPGNFIIYCYTNDRTPCLRYGIVLNTQDKIESTSNSYYERRLNHEKLIIYGNKLSKPSTLTYGIKGTFLLKDPSEMPEDVFDFLIGKYHEFLKKDSK